MMTHVLITNHLYVSLFRTPGFYLSFFVLYTATFVFFCIIYRVIQGFSQFSPYYSELYSSPWCSKRRRKFSDLIDGEDENGYDIHRNSGYNLDRNCGDSSDNFYDLIKIRNKNKEKAFTPRLLSHQQHWVRQNSFLADPFHPEWDTNMAIRGLKLLLLVYFIGMDVSLLVMMRMSHKKQPNETSIVTSTGNNHQDSTTDSSNKVTSSTVKYNTTLLVACAELMKLFLANVFLYFGLFRGSGTQKGIQQPPQGEESGSDEELARDPTSSSSTRKKDYSRVETRVEEIQDGNNHGTDENSNNNPFAGEIATTSWKNYLRYGFPATFYAVQNNLNIIATNFISIGVFMLFNSSKLLFSAIVNYFLLKQKFHKWQMTGLVVLFMALIISRAEGLFSSKDTPKTTPTPESSSSSDQMSSAMNSLIGISLVLCTSFLSGLCGGVNEFLLKGSDPDVLPMRKNTWFYQWGLVINLFFLTSSEIRRNFFNSTAKIDGVGADIMNPNNPNDLSFFSRLHSYICDELFIGFTIYTWGTSLCMALFGVSISLILQYFDNVLRAVVGVMPVFLGSLAGWFLLGEEVSTLFLICAASAVSGILLYQRGALKLKEEEG